MANTLESLKYIEYSGVRELAKAAEHFLHNTETSQGKKNTTEYPTERTIRYYITEGLLDQAIEKRGVTSIFGYEHLLTLLAIKKLQSDGLPISVIKSVLGGRSAEDLEKLLGEEVRVFTSEQDLEDFRRKIGHTAESEVRRVALPMAAAAPPPERPKKNAAREYLESILLGGGRRSETEPPPSAARADPPAQPQRPTATSDWRRYEIVPGVELHIARSFRPPQDKGFRNRLLVLIDGILQSRERRQK